MYSARQTKGWRTIFNFSSAMCKGILALFLIFRVQSYKKIISAPKNCQSFDAEIIVNQGYVNEIEKVTLSSLCN